MASRYEILDPQRIQRPVRGRRIEWRVSAANHLRFRDHLDRLVALEYENQRAPEVLEEIAALQEEIRRLPGFPVGYNVEDDVIEPVVTTVMR